MQSEKHSDTALPASLSWMQLCSFREFLLPLLSSTPEALPWELAAGFKFPCKLTSSIYRTAEEEPFGFKLMKKGRESSLRFQLCSGKTPACLTYRTAESHCFCRQCFIAECSFPPWLNSQPPGPMLHDPGALACGDGCSCGTAITPHWKHQGL